MNEICGSKRYFQFIKWRPSGRPLLFLFHKSTFARIMQGSIYLSCMYIIVYMCIFICLCNYIFSTYIQIHQNKMFLSLTWQTFLTTSSLTQGASNHRGQGGDEKLHKQRKEMKSFPTTGCRSEARLEPKQKRNTGVRPKHLIIWYHLGVLGVDWVLGYIRTSRSKRTSVYLCQT